ncbi:MAG: extracellular solute-binding protein [Clostridia bacterium]
MKKTISLICIIVLVLTMSITFLVGCKSSDYDFTVMVYDRGEGFDYEDNITTQWINNNGPATIKWVPIQRTDFVGQLNAYLAAKDYPDVIHTYDRTHAMSLVSTGLFEDITDLFKEHCEETYRTAIDDSGLFDYDELIRNYCSVDGKQYIVPAIRPSVAQNGIYIRQDWLDKLDLDMPTTVEEFYDVCLAFSQNNLDGLPAGTKVYGYDFAYAGLSVLYNMFNVRPYPESMDMNVDEEGNVIVDILGQNFKDMITLGKAMIENGIANPEYITDKDGVAASTAFNTGRMGTSPSLWHSARFVTAMSIQADTYGVNPEVVGVPALKYNGKIMPYFQTEPVSTNILIAKKAKNKDKIMQWLNWMLLGEDNTSGGWFTLANGFEGDNFIYKNIDGEKTVEKIPLGTIPAPPAWYGAAYKLDLDYTKTGMWKFVDTYPAEYRPYTQKIDEYGDYLATLHYAHNVWQPIREAADFEANFTLEYQQILAKVLKDSTYSVDKAMQDLQTKWNEMNGNYYVGLYSAQYKSRAN